MLRLSIPTDLPAEFGETVVTIGNFDGVHRGHAILLDVVLQEVRSRSVRSIAVVFEPHPLRVLHPEKAPALISSLAGRLELLDSAGLDAVLIMEFTRKLAAMTPEEFVRQVFVEALHATCVVVGNDTRFGVKNSGNVDTLRELGVKYHFVVRVLADVGEGRRFSSSDVRRALAEGDVTVAAEILGRPHEVRGDIVRGLQRGRDLGFPTVNLGRNTEGLVPADGVYAGWLIRESRSSSDPEYRMPAAISVGTNPTFDDVSARTVEAYVLDRYDLDLYDETVRVQFDQRLRGNAKFDSIDALVIQICQDVDAARELLR